MKTLNSRQFAVVKRAAQNNRPLVKKLATIDAKIAALEAEKLDINAQIEAFEMGVKFMTGGLTSSQLVVSDVVPQVDASGAPKYDESGKPLTKVVFSHNPKTLNKVGDTYEIVDKALAEETNDSVETESVEEA